MDWIPRKTRKLKIAALEFVGVKKLKVWQAIIKQSKYTVQLFYPNKFKRGNFEFSSILRYPVKKLLLKCQHSNV